MSTRRLFGDKHSRTLSIANINFLEQISTKSRNLMFNVLRNVEIVTFAKIKCAGNLRPGGNSTLTTLNLTPK